MKLLFLTICLLYSLKSQGQLLSPDPEKATLVFFRELPSTYGHECWSCNYQISVNNKPICKLSADRYVVYSIIPGTTIIQSEPALRLLNKRAKRKLILQTDANKVYYIRCDQQIDQTIGRGALAMTLNDVAQAIKTLGGMKMDACSDKL